MIDHADGSDAGDGRRGLLQEGSWDAIHVIEVNTLVQKGAHYSIHGYIYCQQCHDTTGPQSLAIPTCPYVLLIVHSFITSFHESCLQ